MGWQRNYVVLPTGERIRYSLFQRPDSSVYMVRFRSPHGGRPERSTGCVKKPDAIEEAHRLILEECSQTGPVIEGVSWDAAKQAIKEAMEADGKRSRTIGGYIETISRFTELFPATQGPADATEKMAAWALAVAVYLYA